MVLAIIQLWGLGPPQSTTPCREQKSSQINGFDNHSVSPSNSSNSGVRDPPQSSVSPPRFLHFHPLTNLVIENQQYLYANCIFISRQGGAITEWPVSLHFCMLVYTCVHACMLICTFVHACSYVHVYMLVYTFVHAHIYILPSNKVLLK